MRRLYAVADSKGEINAYFRTAAEAEAAADAGDVVLPIVPNVTWERSDMTDGDGVNWIRVDRLARAFARLVRRTGLKRAALAAMCGVSATSMSHYTNGSSPVPALVFQHVEHLADTLGARRKKQKK